MHILMCTSTQMLHYCHSDQCWQLHRRNQLIRLLHAEPALSRTPQADFVNQQSTRQVIAKLWDQIIRYWNMIILQQKFTVECGGGKGGDLAIGIQVTFLQMLWTLRGLCFTNWPTTGFFSCPSSSMPTFLIDSFINGLEFRTIQTNPAQTNLPNLLSWHT